MTGCGEMIGIGGRRPVADRRIVVDDPGSDDFASLVEFEEELSLRSSSCIRPLNHSM
jgi:hypothetical protein